MTNKIKIVLLFLLLEALCPITGKTQILIREDIKRFVQEIPLLPESLQAFHNSFTIKTKYGDKLGDGIIFNPICEKLKTWVASLHDKTILKRIKQARRTDMSFDVQYEDERWQLAIRPLIGPQLMKASILSGEGRQLANKLVDIEKIFDWQQYYKAEQKMKRDGEALHAELRGRVFHLEEKIPMVQTEWGLQKDPAKLAALNRTIAKEKLAIDLTTFQHRRETWTLYFNKYVAAVLWLQQLIHLSDFGQKLSVGEQEAILPAMADIQARSLEAIEKMVLEEIALVQQGELIWFDRKLVEQIDTGNQ